MDEASVKRQSIDIEGFRHQGPLPGASKVGPLVESSIIVPLNPGTRDLPETFEEQAANLFSHVGAMLEAAGGGWDNLVKLTFFVADAAEGRAKLNPPWLELFPDPATRPARHTIEDDPGQSKVTCVFTAYIP